MEAASLFFSSRNQVNMVNLRLQKRLAASILGCGRGKVWLDPNESNEISMANSRQNIRKLIKDGFVIRKPQAIHTRFRARAKFAAKRLGRHMGTGKRRGTRDARMPSKGLWIKRQRVLRRLLKKYRDAKKIDKHLYRELYMKAKGNVFKNKKNLMEYIFKAKSEKLKEKQLNEQAEARRQKNRSVRERRAAKAAVLLDEQNKEVVVVADEKPASKKTKGDKVDKTPAVQAAQEATGKGSPKTASPKAADTKAAAPAKTATKQTGKAAKK
eukprot:TRINITY_DN12709_c0_g1_i1.p1 TRINITY_DN12709_c0_g1~~TRINITY_DN12709_c0_g1_i1.p1  ORF type:complete len:269 (-),score=94.31 TRINITY_DN12709_c0_g1_i1:117-923(-)